MVLPQPTFGICFHHLFIKAVLSARYGTCIHRLCWFVVEIQGVPCIHKSYGLSTIV